MCQGSSSNSTQGSPQPNVASAGLAELRPTGVRVEGQGCGL